MMARRFSEAAIRIVTALAFGWSVAYLAWRIVATTSGSSHRGAAGLLLFTELVGFVLFAARARKSLRVPAEFRAIPGVPFPDLIAVVDGANCDSGDLHATLLALRKCDGLRSIIVAEAPANLEAQALAHRLGASTDDRRVGEIIQAVSSAWVMVVKAGSIVSPDIIESVAPVCSSADVAVVQVGYEHAEPVGPHHDPLGRYSVLSYRQTIEQRSLASATTMPWMGEGPFLVRRNAISAIGGLATPLPEGAWDAGLRFTRAGFRVVAVPLVLARVRSAPSIGESFRLSLPVQRARVRSLLHPARWRGLPLAVVQDHVAVAVEPLSGLYRWLQGAVIVVVLGFSLAPIDTSLLTLLVAAGPAYGLRWAAQIMLGRATLRPASMARRDMQNMGNDLAALLFGGFNSFAGGSAVLLATLLAVAGAVVLGIAGVTTGWSQNLAGDSIAEVLSLTSLYLGLGVAVLVDSYVYRRRRRGRRTRLGRVSCLVGGIDGQIADVSNSGAAVLVGPGGALPPTIRPGSNTTIEFRIPDVDGAWRGISTTASVMYAADANGSTRLGMMFDDPLTGALDPLIEFLNVPRRHLAHALFSSADF